MVEPMSFDRIGNLGKSSTMKARLQEEVRLVEIAQGTRVRYTSSAPSRVTNDQINCNKEYYRLSSTCGVPRNHTNVQPVDAHV